MASALPDDQQRSLVALQVLSSRISVVNELAADLNATDDFERIMRILAGRLKWILNFQIGGLATIDSAGHITLHPLQPAAARPLALLPGGWLHARLAAPQAMIVDVGAEAPAVAAAFQTDLAVRSLLCIPLRTGPIHEGTLVFGATAADAYKLEDTRIAHLLGLQVSGALQRTRLAGRLRAEHDTLSVLYAAIKQFAALTTADAVARTLVELGVAASGAQRGTLIEWGDDEPPVVIRWPGGQEGAVADLFLAHEPDVRAAAQADPWLIGDRADLRHWTAAAIDESATQSLLGVPLRGQHHPRGLLLLAHDDAGALGRDQLSLAAAIATQADIMLQNVQLYEREHRLLQQYVGSSVANHLLHNPQKAVLGGQRQIVTVLFADLENFTAYADRHDPEELMATLNRYVGLAVEAILAEGGTCDKFMGDGVMAIFNAPAEQPDHALRAARAALRLQQLIAAYHRLTTGQQQLRFRIGLHSGEAVVGNVGTDAVRNYTAIGDTVNVAKRIQEQAEAGQVLCSAAIRDAIAHALPLESAGMAELKGKQQQYMLYRLQAAGELQARAAEGA
ncbi:MAG TPA: adenylate/guanylate cyclase domain-containing protein [Herpetosiphonaceae bacterium]